MEFDDDKVDMSDLEDLRGQGGSPGGGMFGGAPGGGGSAGSRGGGGGGALGGLAGAAIFGMLGKAMRGGGQQAPTAPPNMGSGFPPGASPMGAPTTQAGPPQPPSGGMSPMMKLLMFGLAAVLIFGLFKACSGGGSSTSTTTGGSSNAAATSIPGAGGALPAGAGDPQSIANRCVNTAAILQYDDCYILKSSNEINEVWTKYFAAQGQQYVKPKLVYFTKGVKTGCGFAQSSAGPFYCPPDRKVYIDLDYMNTLFRQIGAEGRYAQTYVVAHEIGHHLQTLLGTEAQVRKLQQRNPGKANQYSVLLELQADCYAGVFGRLANDQGNIKITEAEFAQALQAAAAVGDDKIMASAGMRVNPDKFTHGSAAQRQQWFQRGFENPNLGSCNTFQ